MSRVCITPNISKITSDSPRFNETVRKLEEIGVLALKDDPLTMPTVALYSENPDRYHTFVRMQLEVGLIGGHIYGAFLGEVIPENLLGFSMWYEPGTEFMASEEEHGPWDAYMQNILPETKKWWDEILLPRVSTLAKDSFGNIEKNTMFQLQLLAVHPSLRRQGIGATLCRHGTTMADAAGAPACLETNSDDNIKFYASVGFQVKGQVLMTSRFGDFTMTCMYRQPSIAMGSSGRSCH